LSFAYDLPQPDLPSFPTRRSSDLQPLTLIAWGEDDGVPSRRRGNSARQGSGGEVPVPQITILTNPPGLRLSWYLYRGEDNVRFRDRKSTRLNSSHVSRSYAVFCLK